MKFGGLSESEVEKISAILNAEGVPFSIDKDSEIEDFNSRSIKNDLRHFTPPNISTHILSIAIADEDFLRLSSAAKTKLLDYGITDQAPSPEDFRPFTGSTIHKDLVEGPRRMLAMNFKHQLVAGIVILVIYYLLSK